MNLEVFNNLFKNNKENNFIQNFIKELSDYLNKEEKEGENLQEDNNLNELREEDCLYQVVDRGRKGIYLQNTKNNKIFEETDISKEIQDKIGNDYILRYKDGKYVIEEELTDDFFNSMIDINEYKKIQEEFIKESNIEEFEPDTKFNILYREDDCTILSYENDEKNQIKVPNTLLPFFIYDDTVLYYKEGKFEKCV